MPNTNRNLSRRKFITASAAGAAAFSVTPRGTAAGFQANSRISIGVVGCGGRGSWIAGLFQQHGGYQVAAAADYFDDRVQAFGEKFHVEPARRFTGLSCYQRLLESKVDAMVIESPPYFHPAQAAAGVDAGVHVYLAKPIAVDVPGCQSVTESSAKAAANKKCFLVDFQTRTDPFYQEAVTRVQSGAIGRIINGEACYFAGSPWLKQIEYVRTRGATAESRLRAWGIDRVLSGDVITEQNIHAIDVATWILDAHPTSATGTGGLSSRPEGSCWDHFSAIFNFPNHVPVSFCSKQFGSGYDDILCRIYGSEGDIETHYAGEVKIAGKSPYAGGNSPGLYRDGAARNIATFYDHVTQGDYSNSTTAPSVRSNLTTILGRMAAYQGGEVAWEEMMRAGEKWEFDHAGLQT